MPAVDRTQSLRLAIKADLPANRRGQVRDQRKLMVVTGGVSLYTGQGLFCKARRLRLFAQQQLTGAVQIFNTSPNTVTRGKLQRGFGQVAVEDLTRQQRPVSAPE